MKTRCDGVQELLIEYADGDLGRENHEAVRQHIAECSDCAAELAEIEGLRVLLADDGYVEPSPFYWTRFNALLQKRLHPAGRWGGAVGRWQGLVPRLVPVAVALLCFGVGLWVGFRPNAEQGSVPGGTPSYGDVQLASDGPLVSPRAKHLVETGVEHGEYAFAADTLEPEGFRPAPERPRVFLATSERQAEMQQRLERQYRD